MPLIRLVHVVPFALLLAGCTGDTPPLAFRSDAEPGSTASAAYTLASGDKLRIIVYGEESLTGEYTVAQGGAIAFPLIGDVAATGVSTTELQRTIAARLSQGYIKDPRVNVEVLNYRPYYILGEVAKPGEYPYRPGLTFQQAVAAAGGYTYRANTKRIAIKHATQTSERSLVLTGGQQPAVQPGDTIRILERFF